MKQQNRPGINTGIKFKKPTGVLTAALLLSGMFFLACGAPPDREKGFDIGQALSSTSQEACFDRADREKVITFPRDLGPHNTFQTEWWYYTGNLTDRSGSIFGYQLTFFRRALTCEPPRGSSKWRTGQLYFAHFALTDVTAKKFYTDTRMNRESVGIAGAMGNPYRVWINDWEALEKENTIHLRARGSLFSLNLELSPGKPPVFQGKSGLSQKSALPGNASYYYSFPRIDTQGTLQTPKGEVKVKGLSWFDHEWSTSALGNNEKGWDWFALHLEDGKDIMVCQVRKADNRPNGFSFGCISHAHGGYDILGPDDFTIKSTDTWKSPVTGGIYPSAWTIFLSPLDMTLNVTPYIKNQEHTGEFVYWEGAVKVSGKNSSGSGYVELTGYQTKQKNR
ncbi:Predicted secreted hydrolase [Desulfocicer vacuolatum DSM 3385]|uniref:Predicted secreted hydrolase n=1 Tax=Desulfocicer vacuolatum DSM 3385 TaxID=1121400 RepID=A0A1W2DWF3_9BACT|nr:lipocalin-like domain-containing protein [Desulfocicer vacuolatum]SMD01841.1 Predicted secreted hydrolase [Desulfocicer vacuolatum DSM 3385]